MPDHRHPRTPALLVALPCLCLCLALWPALSHAQDARWYRVELMVFKHLPGDRSETFAAIPELAYPEEFRFLVDPGLVAANRKRHPGRDYLTGNGRQVFEPVEVVMGEPTAPVPQEQSQEPEERALPAAFLIEPDSAQAFRGKAAYMQRSGRYEILFHETWAQPVVGEQAALPIILDRSGDSESWPQLQGSVKLYLSRYLHLETDLWLNTRGDYLGDNGWQMPAPPRAPQSLIVEVAEEEEALPEPGIPASMAPSTTSTTGIAAAGPSIEPESAGEEVDPRTLYPWRHAVAMKQKRRMRSEEIHYIDHPLLGVVARLVPLTPEEVEALTTPATAEPAQALPAPGGPVAQ